MRKFGLRKKRIKYRNAIPMDRFFALVSASITCYIAFFTGLMNALYLAYVLPRDDV